MQVADVMSKAVVTVMPGHSVKHAAQIMLDHQVSGLPVVDGDGKLVGILTEGDLLRRVEFGLPSTQSKWAIVTSSGGSARDYVKSHSWRVGDVMTKPVATIGETASLADVATLFSSKGIKRLPVLRNGEIVGIVSRADLLRVVAAATPDMVMGGDEAIKISADAYLRDADSLLSARPQVTVEHGVIHLWGQVGSEAERDAARVAVESVHGINGVEDHLTIAAPVGA